MLPIAQVTKTFLALHAQEQGSGRKLQNQDYRAFVLGRSLPDESACRQFMADHDNNTEDGKLDMRLMVK